MPRKRETGFWFRSWVANDHAGGRAAAVHGFVSSLFRIVVVLSQRSRLLYTFTKSRGRRRRRRKWGKQLERNFFQGRDTRYEYGRCIQLRVLPREETSFLGVPSGLVKIECLSLWGLARILGSFFFFFFYFFLFGFWYCFLGIHGPLVLVITLIFLLVPCSNIKRRRLWLYKKANIISSFPTVGLCVCLFVWESRHRGWHSAVTRRSQTQTHTKLVVVCRRVGFKWLDQTLKNDQCRWLFEA